MLNIAEHTQIFAHSTVAHYENKMPAKKLPEYRIVVAREIKYAIAPLMLSFAVDAVCATIAYTY